MPQEIIRIIEIPPGEDWHQKLDPRVREFLGIAAGYPPEDPPISDLYFCSDEALEMRIHSRRLISRLQRKLAECEGAAIARGSEEASRRMASEIVKLAVLPPGLRPKFSKR